eukprot:gene16547-18222_t
MDEKIGETKILGDGMNIVHGIEKDALLTRTWEAIIMLSTFVSLLSSSFLASYDSTNTLLIVLLYVCDVLYLCDAVASLYIVYGFRHGKKDGKCSSRRRISNMGMAFDVVSLIPFELFAFAQKLSHTWLYSTSLHRLNRIARFYRIFSYFSRCEDRIGTNIQLTRALKHVFVAYGVVHLMACGWFLFSCENRVVYNARCYEGSWAIKESNHPIKIPMGDMTEFSILEKYLTCLYWSAITVTSTGYGDIHAVTTKEKWYSVVCMLIGFLYFYGSILGDMGSSMTNSDQKRACYKHKINAIAEQLKNRKVSKEISRNVKGYYEHMWIQNQGISGIGMFNELPLTFQAELSLDVNRHLLDKAPMFQDMCPGFRRMLSTSIQSTTYSPGQTVFKKNDIGHCLFYVRSGEVQIFFDESAKPIKTFGPGSFFGEISLVWNVPRAATARTSCYSDILALNRTDLNRVMKHYPEVQDRLRLTIEQRYENAEKTRQRKIMLHVNDDDNICGKARKKSMFGSMNLRKLIFDRVFQPDSSFVKKWSRIMCALNFFFITLHTSIASFEVSFGSTGYGNHPVLIIIFCLWYIYDILIIFDILIELRTAVHHHTKGFIQDSKAIVNLQLKSALFWLDIISVLPIEIFAFCFTTGESRWLAATFLKSNRVFRIFHIPRFFKRLEEDINNNLTKSRSVMLFIYMFLTSHLTACMLYLQACVGQSCANPSWAFAIGISKDTHVIHHYIIAVYWACATMTSTGYGDVSAMSFRDEVFVLLVLFIGLLMYGYLLSSIAGTVNNLVAPKTGFMEHTGAVLKFMKNHNISEKLMKEVETNLKLVWRTHKGQSLPGARTLMDDMPLFLQEDVAYDEMKQILQDVPIFKDTDERFQRMISLVTKTYLFTPGDTIVQVGDMSRTLYIVRRGHAEVLSADRSCVVATCGPGGYFGEVGFFYGESRPSDVRAKTYCETVMISKADLDKVLVCFPVIAKQLQNIVDNIAVLKRLKSTAHEEAKRSHHIEQEKILLNSKSHSGSISSTENATASKRNRLGQWKLGKINPLYNHGLRKISLPNKLTAFSNDKTSTPEYRQHRRMILEREEQREYYNELNVFMKLLSMILMRRTISPDSGFFRAWIFLTVSLAYVYLLLVGLSMTFLHAEHGVEVIEGMFDVFFLIDIYVKLHVCFYNDEGILVSHSMKTAENYLRTNFLFDFLAVIPFNRVVRDHSSGITYFGKINRILHIIKVVQFFSFFQLEIGQHINIIRPIAMNSYMLLMTHYFACAWFLVACPEFTHHHHEYDTHENATFVDAATVGKVNDFHHKHFKCGVHSWAMNTTTINIYHESYVSQYITSIYWAISTLCSVGYGDIHAYMSMERVLACVCMIVGVITFGYIITVALAYQSTPDSHKSVYLERLQGIERFLLDQEISLCLQQRVLKKCKTFFFSHYKYVWQKTLGVDMKNLFEGLPTAIQGKICLSLYQSYLTSVPLFQGLEVGFIKMLSLVIKPLYIIKHEYIVKKGDIAQEIYFIKHGAAGIVSEESTPRVLSRLSAGCFFGEVSVICSSPVQVSIRALTNTELLILSKKDLENVLDNFPKFKTEIFTRAKRMQSNIKEEDEESGGSSEGLGNHNNCDKRSDVGNEEDDTCSQQEGDHESPCLPQMITRKTTDLEMNNESTDEPRCSSEDGQTAFQSLATSPHIYMFEIGNGTNEMPMNGNSAGCRTTRNQQRFLGAAYHRVNRWRRFAIGEDSRVRYIRQVNCVAIFMTYLTITYTAAFQHHSNYLFAFNYLCEASFFLQIYLNFHMTYSTDDGETVDDYDQIFNHYFKGEFRFDIIANFPLEILALVFPSHLRLTAFSYLRLIHLLRVVRVVQIYNEWVKELTINILALTLTKNLICVSLYVHSFACIWYIVACPSECIVSSWVADIGGDVTKIPLFSLYADSFYWAVATMTSTGYGDIHANNTIEMIFASIVIISGKVIFGFVLGTITSSLANIEAHRVEFEDKLTVVQAHMRSQSISVALQKRVVDFFRYNWVKNRGLPVASLLNDLPYCLHAEICYTLIGDIISQVPMFENCGMPFRRLMCTRAQFCHFYPGEFVTNDGDIGQGMYIIRKGKVESVSKTKSGELETIRYYSDGDFFGEDNVIFQRPCAETIKTVTHADLFLFTISDIRSVLQTFREEAIVIDQNTRRLKRLSVIEEEM